MHTWLRFTNPFSGFILALLLVAVNGGTYAQRISPRQVPDEADSTTYQVFSDRLRSAVEEGERVTYLEGGVRIEHQTTTITSGSGKHYRERQYVRLIDNVRVQDGTLLMLGDIGEYHGQVDVLTMEGNVRGYDKGWEMYCDRVRYDREQAIAILTGRVRIADSTRVIFADSIYYDRAEETADAFGRVVLLDQVEDYSIAGKHARFDRSKEEAVVDEQPILTFDLTAEEKGTVISRWMHFDIDDEIGTAVGDVRMVKGETRASCDSAAIYNEEGRVELYGGATASNGPSGMTGESMILYYNEDEVERVILPESGRLTESPREGSPWREDSWIDGDSIIIHLTDEKVDSVRIIGSSRAMYYPIEGEEGKVSNNFSTGDTMFFRFKDQDLNYVRVSGNSTGIYNFLNLASSETIDSIAASIDSSVTYREFRMEAERIRYSARMIEYYADTEDIVLSGKAALQYQDKGLTADHIDFNSRINVLDATGDPVLEEAKQKMYGLDMGYDMDYESGIVRDGSTRYDAGFYRGGHIFKVGKDVLKVYNSNYSTCEYKRSHYSFRAKKMKVYINDKIVSGPIVLYIGEIPIFYLPFMVNSLRRERHSGFLRPNFDIGIDSREGRFVRGFGYYWATNDYTDFIMTTDFNERRSFRVHLTNRYKIRYLLDGNVNLNFYRNLVNYTNEWTVASRHNQKFWGNATLNSNLKFVSSDRAQIAMDQAQDVQKIVDRRIYSSASFRKSWGGTKLSISASRNQKLNVTSPTQSKISATLPSLSLNLPRTSLWFGEKHKGAERGFWERMLGSILFSPNLKFTRKTGESDARKTENISAQSSAGFSQQHKLLFINLSPSVNMGWNYFKVLRDEINPAYADQVSGLIRPDDRNEFSLSLSSGFGTTLYGIFYPKIGSLRGIRHTINPTVSYSYSPKIGESQVERKSVSYSIRNVLDLKVMQRGEEVKKSNVITWNVRGSYNPKLPEKQRFSRISSSLRTSLGLLSFSLNHSIDPYEWDILSTHFSTGLNLSSTFSYPGSWIAPKRERITAAQDAEGAGAYGDGLVADQYGGGGAQSWSLNMSYSYSQSGQGFSRRVDSQLNLSGQLQVTKGWRITYSSHYDVDSGKFTTQQYSIKRDLHCWQASFVHRKFGNEWSYYFQIAIKAHPEITYERGPRGLQGLMGF
ncbi:MAG: hypothetical protein JSV33_10210 [bacterium]|nr:MAG: hypothetical protein JSV33_10210 [bacterium]